MSSIELFARPALLPAVMSQVAPWKLNKSELVAELGKLNITVNPRWTVLELRHVLSQELKARKGTDNLPKGIASMNLLEPRNEASRLGISYTAKDTKALLTLRIRDTTCPDETLMTLGRFQGIMYKDIPKGYANWTVREMEVNRDNMHPDLLRFALWHQDRMKAAAQGYSYQGNRLDRCETEAKIPPPPVSETGSSASWMVIHGEDTPKAPETTRRRSEPMLTATSSAEKDILPKDTDDDLTRPIPPKAQGTVRRRTEATTPTTTRMDQDVPEVVKREIQELETRLALLRDASGLSRGQ